MARDTKLDRDVALKVLPDVFANDADRLARFQREAKVLASLNHPNIGSIYGIEEDETEGGKISALVLELIDGPTLADRIAQGPIPIDEALPIATQIAEALEVAHEQGIIHRDLKPANIKLRPDGIGESPRFWSRQGVPAVRRSARLQRVRAASPTISLTAVATQMGMVIGTAAYMSPEQARGKPVDKRADIWASGVVLYEMLTGSRPFQGEDVSLTLASVMKSDVDANDVADRTCRRPSGQCCAGAWRKDPSQRIRDVGDVRLAMAGAFESTVADAGGCGCPTAVTALAATGPRPPRGRARGPRRRTHGVGPADRAEPRAVTRIAYDLPPSHQLRVTSRQVLAVSPDGRRFVYNTADGLYLRSLDAFEPRLLAGTEDTLGTPVLFPRRPGGRIPSKATSDQTACVERRRPGQRWSGGGAAFWRELGARQHDSVRTSPTASCGCRRTAARPS